MLPLIIAPNKILRTPTLDLNLPLPDQILKLIPRMYEAMRYYHGIGLAAPQINKSLRIMVIATADGPQVFINPRVTKVSRKQEQMEEGCLSLPGLFGVVSRPYTITVEYISVEGKKIKARYQGLMARVYQHEVDHLDGVLFIDKVSQITNGQEKLAKYKSG